MPYIYIQRAHQDNIFLSAQDPPLLGPPAVAHLGEVEVGALGVELEIDRLRVGVEGVFKCEFVGQAAVGGAEVTLEVRHKVVCQRLRVVAVGLHEALEGGDPRVHRHAVKERVPRRALRACMHA